MAKLNYSKPLFDIRPIPLAAAGGSGGCAYESNKAQYQCPVQTEFELVFTDTPNSGCEVYSQGGEVVFCYTVPENDCNVYNS